MTGFFSKGSAPPQKHGQRSYNQQIEYWDTGLAKKLGVTDLDTVNRDFGLRFYPLEVESPEKRCQFFF